MAGAGVGGDGGVGANQPRWARLAGFSCITRGLTRTQGPVYGQLS